LNPNKKKLESKGVDSVASRVMNLADRDPNLSHEPFCEALESSFIEYYGGTVERETLSISSAGQQNAIVQNNY
jgi:lipoate-protein ligase A